MEGRVEEVNKGFVEFVEPITHGSQRVLVGPRELYFAAINAYKEHGKAEFSIFDRYDVRFYSKRSGLYWKKGNRYMRAFEYVIDIRDRIFHKKLVVTLNPRVKGLYYKDKNSGEFKEFKLIKDRESTLLIVQSSYLEQEDIIELLREAFKKLDINEAYLAAIDYSESVLKTKERHIRVSISVEKWVANELKKLHWSLADEEDVRVADHIDRDRDVYKFYKVTFKGSSIIPEEFDGIAFYVKIYRLKYYYSANLPDNLKNSFKIEAGIDPKWSERSIPLEMEKEITEFLDRLVITILNNAGVQPGHLLEDDHFKPYARPVVQVEPIRYERNIEVLVGRRINSNMELLFDDLMRAVLKIISLNEWVSPKALAAELGYSERHIRRILKALEEAKILIREHTLGETWVHYRNRLLQEAMKERIEQLERAFGAGDAIEKVKAKVRERIKRRLTVLKKRLMARRIPFRFKIVVEAETDGENEDIVPIIERFLAQVRDYLNPYLAKEWDRLIDSLRAPAMATATAAV